MLDPLAWWGLMILQLSDEHGSIAQSPSIVGSMSRFLSWLFHLKAYKLGHIHLCVLFLYSGMGIVNKSGRMSEVLLSDLMNVGYAV